MIRLWYAPRTRSVRVLWLLEELGLPYELERVEFEPTVRRFFSQRSPTGKLPTIQDGDVVMCESGAIIEYLLERYGEGRLAPPVGSPERPAFLQWLHFAESTAFPPVGFVVWLTVYRDDSDQHPKLVADARSRAEAAFEFLEDSLGERRFLLGDEFTAADVMMGFTVVAARAQNLLGEQHPRILAYMGRVLERPALKRALAAG